MEKYSIFCDESCHLEHDGFPVMCIGYIKIDDKNIEKYKNKIKEIKHKHHNHAEFKWSNVSRSRLPFYKELIHFFFSHDLFFRCILVKYKEKLDHSQYNQGSHDNFYYKLIYHLLNTGLNSIEDQHSVYLDIKDTNGRVKLLKIDTILRNKFQGKSPFVKFQHIRSEENIFIQFADFFIGAITYKSRNVSQIEGASPIKSELLKLIEENAGYNLDEGTEPWETKFNIFDHQPKNRNTL